MANAPTADALFSVQRRKRISSNGSKYADRLIRHIEENPGFIEPESRRREMLNNFLYAGLQDLCVSRTSFKWGIPVSFDDKHVIYVWIDALSNYITGLGFDPDKEPGENYKKYWPADVHIIGKDILRFHTIYWPILLMALGEPLPKKVFGHPWFNVGQDKMSKSRGNVFYADDMVRRFGVDGVRYYALSEMPYANDGSITYENVISRYNNDLANNLGNLVSRTIAMAKKYFDGIVPSPDSEEELDKDLKNTVLQGIQQFGEQMDAYHIADAMETVFSVLRRANRYYRWNDSLGPCERLQIAGVAWALFSIDLLESIRVAAVLLTPAIPTTCTSIFTQLGTDKTEYDSLTSFLECWKQESPWEKQLCCFPVSR